MKPLKCALTTLAVFISINAGAQITLDECIENAFSNYPQIKEKELIQASEGFDLKNASLAWVPQLSISAKATWQSEVVEMPFSFQYSSRPVRDNSGHHPADMGRRSGISQDSAGQDRSGSQAQTAGSKHVHYPVQGAERIFGHHPH